VLHAFFAAAKPFTHLTPPNQPKSPIRRNIAIFARKPRLHFRAIFKTITSSYHVVATYVFPKRNHNNRNFSNIEKLISNSPSNTFNLPCRVAVNFVATLQMNIVLVGPYRLLFLAVAHFVKHHREPNNYHFPHQKRES